MLPLPDISASDVQPLVPAILLVLGACILLVSEVFLRTSNRGYMVPVTLLFTLLAGGVSLSNVFEPAHPVFLGFGVLDPFSSFLSFVVCLALGFAALTAAGFLRNRHAERGEFYALLMFGAAGMSLLAMSNELITIFINIEVLSVATYALTAYLRRGSKPSEAGFKYFILGAFSSAVLVYGTSLLFGATGTTHLGEMAQAMPTAVQEHAVLCAVGAILVSAGFAFKVGAVPFHMWTPDVYEGAPSPVTAFMSAGVKAAAFAALVRVLLVVGKGLDPQAVVLILSVLAFLTMVVGNLVALPQRNVKRMLAYSSIAHAGYVLVAVASLFATDAATQGGTGGGFSLLGVNPLLPAGITVELAQAQALRGILFYLLAYTVTTVGSFGIISVLERRENEGKGTAWDLERFAGLAARKPGWAFAMALFMLSLGGIPPTVGFMGKLLIFRSAVDTGLVGLAVVGVLTSAAAIYYYLRVVVYMYMRPAAEGEPTPVRPGWAPELALALSALLVVGLGILPGPLTDWLQQAGSMWMGR